MGKTILLADDSITIQKIVNLTFSGEGIDVVTVGNGDAALKKAYDICPDLILADIFMPGKNGYEVCEHIKSDPQLSRIPVILLVGAFEPFDSNESARVKADGHLTKPFEIKVLISAVNSLISAAEEEKVSASIQESDQAEVEIPAASESAFSSGELAETKDEVPESVPSFQVVVEPVSPATPPSQPFDWKMAPSEEPTEDEQKQDRIIEFSAPKLTPAISIEDPDPLGLYTAELVSEITALDTERIMDPKSLVVDIWEPQPAEGEEVLSEIVEGQQEVPLLTPAAVVEEVEVSRPLAAATVVASVAPQFEEGIPELIASEPMPEPPVSVQEDQIATAKAIFVSEPSQSKAPSLPLAGGMEQSELVELITHKVMEKLSKEVIEKIAWEVVPDLAEILIKEQLESHFKGAEKV